MTFSFNRPAWDEQELTHVRLVLERPIETAPQPLSSRELVRRYPGAMPWFAVHPIAAVAILISVASALLALISSG
jgi:hypothetical protein